MRTTLAILVSALITGHAVSAQTPPSATSAPATERETATQSSESAAARLRSEATIARNDASTLKPLRKLNDDELLALAAIESLMTMPPERALPPLKKVLAGSQSLSVKERALFVLGQLDSQESNALMLEYAKAAQSPLRSQAIRNIGIGGNNKTIAALQEVYANGDAGIKKDVLQAWMIAGRKTEVYQVATNAKSESEASEAIKMLAVMGAKEELRKLSESQKNNRSLVEAFSISGDLESLKKIANGSGDTSVRLNAVRSIGIVGGEAGKTALREIYQNNSDAKLKDAALHGMLIAGDEQGVLSLYRAAKNTDEKRSLLKMLSIMGGDAAMQAIDAALEGKK
jgi:HEAT repeat protein